MPSPGSAELSHATQRRTSALYKADPQASPVSVIQQASRPADVTYVPVVDTANEEHGLRDVRSAEWQNLLNC